MKKNERSKNNEEVAGAIAPPLAEGPTVVVEAVAPVVADFTPYIGVLLSGGDNLGNGFARCLHAMAAVNGALNLTRLFEQHGIQSHIRNRIITVFRADKKFSVNYSDPLIARLK